MAISQDCSEFQENLGEFETFYRRFPRRFAPRNDKAEALCHTEDTPTFSPCLPSETFGWTGFSTPRHKNEMYRPASRTVSLSKSPFGSFAKLPSKLQNFFVVLFCNFAAAAGYLTRKDTLTVSFQLVKKVPSGFLPSCFQNCKMKFCSIILQFCRCGGLLNAKGNPDGFLVL